LARLERFDEVESTQRVVATWLADGTPEVAVAVADVQTAGRGRLDRTWTAPPGAALLCSVGFRPGSLAALHGWRLGAIVSLAMLDAAEEAGGLREGRLRLKWPNDIVAGDEAAPTTGVLVVRKLAGVLGESLLGSDGTIASAVVGIGVNADWPASHYPAGLADTMTSLRELSGGRPVDRDALLEGFLARLEPRYEALRSGRFDAGAWSSRQVTTGLEVEVETGSENVRGVARGVDSESGSLRMEIDGQERAVGTGDVVRCRLLG